MAKTDLENTLTGLLNLFPDIIKKPSFNLTLGFDGFIDEIIKVVDKRHSFNEYQPLKTIAEFGERISRSAGLSTNIELVTETIKIGGNGPIMANSLLAMGQKISYLGALGLPEIDPIFSDLVSQCQTVISIAQPAHTDALEFNDGKILLGKHESLPEITWGNLLKYTSKEQLVHLFTEVDLVGMVNWTMLPYMNQIWSELQAFLETISFKNRPLLFIDLADPEKRSSKDLELALKHIKYFSKYYRVVLGLNRKEASEVGKILQLDLGEEIGRVSISEITKELSKALDIWCVMVHSIRDGAAVRNGEFAYLPGPYCDEPKITTGAGDNFNAGFCLGLLLDLSLDKVLGFAKANSGFYVRHGFSPNLNQLQEFLLLWLSNIDKEF